MSAAVGAIWANRHETCVKWLPMGMFTSGMNLQTLTVACVFCQSSSQRQCQQDMPTDRQTNRLAWVEQGQTVCIKERETETKGDQETERRRDRYLFAGSSDSSSVVYREETFDKLKAAINLKPANFRPFFPVPSKSIKKGKVSFPHPPPPTVMQLPTEIKRMCERFYHVWNAFTGRVTTAKRRIYIIN